MQRPSAIQPITTTTTVDELVQQEEAASDNAIWVVFRKMLFFTVMLTLAPITSFFVSKSYLFEGMFGMTGSNSYIYAAFVAVVVVHIILIAFLYVAFRDDQSGKKTKAAQIKGSMGKKD